jgi:glycosyltransferase involved in cell wall biosynthesis
MGRRRVLLVVDQLRRRAPGGIGSYIEGLLAGLETLGGKGARGAAAANLVAPPAVTLYASRGPRGPDPLRGLGWPLMQSPLPGPVMTRAWDRRFLDVPKGFDVVHATSIAAPAARGSRLAVTVHDLTWRQVPETFPARGRRWHEEALKRALRNAAALVVSSEPLAEALVSAGAGRDAVWVIPLGSDHLPPPDLGASEEILRRLGVRGEFLLSVSTREPRKNLPRLLAAYEIARGRLPDPWPLVVVGPEGWGPRLAPRPGVMLAGMVADATLTGLYRTARLVAYVPLEEGFGLPPVEAMREGTPVVASRVPSVGDAAMQVDPLDVEDIADALESVATDESLRQRLVAAGHAHVTTLTWANSARRHVQLWESLS